jgi:CheY-like chemotaxis protein
MKIDFTEKEMRKAGDRAGTGKKTHRPLVFLAEDDYEMRQLLAEALEEDGYRVMEAGSGLKVFDKLRHARNVEETPDLIVSDIRMPGLTGLKLLRIIRDWGWSVPVILITAFGDPDTQAEAVQGGVTAFFSKPFEVDDLRTAVSYYLQYPRGALRGHAPRQGVHGDERNRSEV